LSLFFALIAASGTASAAQTSLTLDGVTLGAPIGDYIAAHGQPANQEGAAYSWLHPNGGRLTLTTDASHQITIIDVRAGTKEVRDVPVLAGTARFNDGGHMNVAPPRPLMLMPAERCGKKLNGSPCMGLPIGRAAELIMNFGADNGTADWDLNELVLGTRSALSDAGFIANP
jgi:hypothetical protein